MLAATLGLIEVPAQCDIALREMFTAQRGQYAPECAPARMGAMRGARWDGALRARCISAFESASNTGVRGLLEHLPRLDGSSADPRDSSDLRTPPIIVDIGSGLALYHLKVSDFYGGHSLHYLIDREANEISHRRAGGYAPRADLAFYNSLACAKQILNANGLNASRVNALDLGAGGSLHGAWQRAVASPDGSATAGRGRADVLISLLSWGYHYPIETYLSDAARVLKAHTGRLIFTLSPWAPIEQLKALAMARWRCTRPRGRRPPVFVSCCLQCARAPRVARGADSPGGVGVRASRAKSPLALTNPLAPDGNRFSVQLQ